MDLKLKGLEKKLKAGEKMNKANKILDDIFIIAAIILFPMWMLKLLGYDKLVR